MTVKMCRKGLHAMTGKNVAMVARGTRGAKRRTNNRKEKRRLCRACYNARRQRERSARYRRSDAMRAKVSAYNHAYYREVRKPKLCGLS